MARISSADRYCAVHHPERVTSIGVRERLQLAFARGVVEILGDGGDVAAILDLAQRLNQLPRPEPSEAAQ